MSENPSPFQESRASGAREDRSDRPAGERYHSRYYRGWSPGPWLGGAVLILLGIVFLLDNIGIDAPFLDNWWAFFILIPAASALVRAWNEYKDRGRLSGRGIGSLIGGLVLTLVAFTFLAGLSWDIALPVLLILGGLSILITAIATNR